MGSTTGPIPEQILTGRAEPPAPTRLLRAGPVTALLDGIDLRTIRVGTSELAQRITVGVRDTAWNTIPAAASELAVVDDGDSFRVTFVARHTAALLDFEWRGTITGGSDGRIEYVMDGTCRGSFRFSRIERFVKWQAVIVRCST